MEPQFCGADEQRIGHVVAAVADIDQLASPNVSETLFDGQEIGKGLGGVPFVGETVPDRHTRPLGHLFHHALLEAPVLDPIEHPTQNPHRVFDGLLLAHLDVVLAKKLGVGPLFDARHGKGTSGPGGAFFEKQSHVLVLEPPRIDSRPPHGLVVPRKIEKAPNFFPGVVVQRKKTSSCQANRHYITSLFKRPRSFIPLPRRG